MSVVDVELAQPAASSAAEAAGAPRRVIVTKEPAAPTLGGDPPAKLFLWDALGGARAALKTLRAARPDLLELHVADLALIKRPLAHKLLLLAAAPLARRRVIDDGGAAEPASLAHIAAIDLPRFVAALLSAPFLLLRLWATGRRLGRPAARRRPGEGPVLVLRPHFFHARFGGTLAHLQGVLGGLAALGREAVLLSTDRPEGLAPAPGRLATHRAAPPRLYADLPQIQELAANFTVVSAARRVFGAAPPALIYQRHQGASLFGLRLAQIWSRPLVLEFNSSDAAREAIWGERRSRLSGFKRRIEQTVLRRADLVVAVSEPLRAQAIGLGAAPERVLVQPNGVDTERFAPRPADPAWRARLCGGEADDAAALVGFLGSLTAYMGLDVLLRAVAIARETGGAAERLRVAIIGEGGARPALERRVAETPALAGRVVFTGAVPFDDAPEALAALDIAVCPHDPPIADQDFYWSPIKLFEYMAAGKAVIASGVGQMAEILSDGTTGRLVPRGDAEALAAALAALAEDPETRARLGAAARRAAVERHGWDGVMARILASAGEARP